MHRVHHALGVDVDHLVPFLGGLSADIGKTRNTGIAEHHVDRAILRLGLFDSAADLGAVADIDLATHRIGQVQRLHPVKPARHQQDRMTRVRKGFGNCGAYTRTCARDCDQWFCAHLFPPLK